MPKISDLNVKLNVSTTFPTDDAYRDALFAALGENLALREVVAGMERQENRALEVAYEAKSLREQVGELKAELAASREREAHPIMVSHPDPDAIRAVLDAAKLGHDEYGRRAPDMAGVDEWAGVPEGGTSPVTGRVRTGDPEVDNLTGVPKHASKVLERLARQLTDEKEGMRRAREEVAVLNARCADYAGVIKELQGDYERSIEELDAMRKHLENTQQAQHDDRMAYQDEMAKLRAEVVRLSACSLITPKHMQSAYDRGVEEGRAALLNEAEKLAHDITPAAAAIAQERAIQRAKYTHVHDRKLTGVQWLALIEEAANRHCVTDWPRTFRVVGALALAALDVLTVEGADHMGSVRKKELPTDHVEDDGSCPPPAADHAPDDVPSP
jgi:predicted  nucleic acid-binding Zn-ribbon protein